MNQREMNVNIPDPARQYVEDRVSAGEYSDARAYILELIENDREGAAALSEVQAQVQAGLKELEGGEFTEYESADAIAAAVKARGRARLAQENRG